MSQSHSFTLDPEWLQAAGPMLAARAQAPRPGLHDIQAHRDSLDAALNALAAHAPKYDVATTTHQVQTRDGATIHVIQVAPNHPQPNGPAVVHAHGGGMISASAHIFVETGSVGMLAASSGATFFTVDYRRAPEHQYDTLVNDTYDALEWVSTNAAKLGIDPTRIAVMGESAGGGISAGVALQARDRKLSPPLRKQILIYPMLDDRNIVPDDKVDHMASWNCASNITGWSALLGKGVPGTDKVTELVKYAVPARVHDLSGLPDTYMDVGQLDIFLLEDIEYVTRLHKAGVQVDFNIHKGLIHAWELYAPDTEVGKRIWAERIAALKSI